jgi:hypothetical protein
MMIEIDERFEIHEGKKSVLVNELTSAAILVNHTLIESLFEEFETRDDSYWLDGKGKIAYLNLLTCHLQRENKFFGGNQKKINKNPGRFQDFCQQNVIQAVLWSLVHEKLLTFLHPEIYAKSKDNMVGAPSDHEPDYIPEFDTESGVAVH